MLSTRCMTIWHTWHTTLHTQSHKGVALQLPSRRRKRHSTSEHFMYDVIELCGDNNDDAMIWSIHEAVDTHTHTERTTQWACVECVYGIPCIVIALGVYDGWAAVLVEQYMWAINQADNATTQNIGIATGTIWNAFRNLLLSLILAESKASTNKSRN